MKSSVTVPSLLEVGVLVDHGHWGGQDHFVVIVVWSGRKDIGDMTLQTFCPSIDKAGHTDDEAAATVKKIFERHLGGTVEFFNYTGDCGGGGKIQDLYPNLVEKLKVMKKD